MSKTDTYNFKIKLYDTSKKNNNTNLKLALNELIIHMRRDLDISKEDIINSLIWCLSKYNEVIIHE